MSGLITGLNGHNKAGTLVDSDGNEYTIGDLTDTEALVVDGNEIVSGEVGGAGHTPWWATRPSYLGAASAVDDEFTSDTTSNYNFEPDLVGTAIDQYAQITTNPRFSAAGIRASHLSVQLPDAAGVTAWRNVSGGVGTDAWLWVRCTRNSRRISTPSGTDMSFWKIGIYVSQNTTDDYYELRVGTMDWSGTDQRTVWFKNQSTSLSLLGNNVLLAADGQPENYTQAIIQKIGTAWYAYVGTDSGDWVRLGAADTYGGAATFDEIAIGGFCDGSVHSTICHFDFVRFGTGVIIVP